MNNLQLSLKYNWFEMTKSGIKTEDYREITPYWCGRLLTAKFLLKDPFAKKSQKWWDTVYFKNSNIDSCVQRLILCARPIQFDNNIMTLGYPKKGDTERILKIEHLGIDIAKGNPDWGAEPNKYYFVIKHGKILS